MNKEILQFNLANTPNFELMQYKTSNDNDFKLSLSWKVWITWNFELTMFELSIHFNIEKIGKWTEVGTKLTLTLTRRKWNFELTV